jgi:GAF domain-containing protein
MAIRVKQYPIPEQANELAGTDQDVQTRAKQDGTEAVLAEALRDIAKTLTSTLQLDEVLDLILSHVDQVVPHDASDIILLQEGIAKVVRHRGYAERGLADRLSDLNIIISDIPGYQEMMSTGQPLIIEDVASYSGWVDIQDQRWQRSYLGVPIRYKGEVIGILNLNSETPSFFTAEQAIRLQAFADQAAIAIVNARLFKEAQQKADEFASLYETTFDMATQKDLPTLLEIIIEHARKLLNSPSGFIYFYDNSTEELELIIESGSDTLRGLRLRLGEGMAGRVAQTHLPLIVDDYRTWEGRTPKYTDMSTIAVVEVPMLFDAELMGVLGVQEIGKIERKYTASDVRLLNLFAAQAASAVHNARLFDEAQRRLKHIQALRDIDMAITGSVDLRVTLNVILERVSSQLQVDAADILLFNLHRQVLEYAGSHGFRTRALHQTRLRLDEGYAGQAAFESRIIHIADLSKEPNGLMRAPLLVNEGFVSYYAVPLIAKGQVKGVLEIYHRSNLNPDREWLDFLEALAGQAALAIDNTVLFENLQSTNTELALAYDATIKGWSRALDLRDKETEGHTQRVTEITLRLARSMGISEDKLVHVQRGALLHDIGKVAVPDHILFKPGPLTEEEWKIMRHHPVYAYNLLSPISYLSAALDIPYYHHEKWDGSGYPHGLIGDQIPLAARIFAVVDVWDALCSNRPYRPAWSEDKALEYIHEQSGKHFDPQVVEAFWSMLGDSLVL